MKNNTNDFETNFHNPSRDNEIENYTSFEHNNNQFMAIRFANKKILYDVIE